MLKERLQRGLITDETGVSPVIGVILMVAVTVIIAAVIGSTALGIGDQVSEAPPQAQLSFDESETELTSGYGHSKYFKTIVVTHDGGENVPVDKLSITVNGDPAYSVYEPQDSTKSREYWGSGGDPVDRYPAVLPVTETIETDALSAGNSFKILASTDRVPNVKVDYVHYGTYDSATSINNRSGDNVGEEGYMSSGDKVQIIWESDGTSQTLSEYTIN